MRETENLVSGTLARIASRHKDRAPCPRNYESSSCTLDSQVLQIVIVPRQIKGNVSRLEIAGPFRYQPFVVRAFGRSVNNGKWLTIHRHGAFVSF